MNPPPPPPPPPLPRRRTRRSLSKYRPQRVSVASSHGHGGTPTGGVSQTPSSSLTPPSQLNLASPSSSLSSSSSSSSPLYLHLPRTFRGPLTIDISSGHISLRLSEGLEREVERVDLAGGILLVDWDGIIIIWMRIGRGFKTAENKSWEISIQGQVVMAVVLTTVTKLATSKKTNLAIIQS
jgi:hypothetical protein